MPLDVQMKIDESSLSQAQHVLRAIPRAFPRAMRRAINRTVDMAATDLKRRVGSEITVKKGDIAKSIGKKKATSTKLWGALSAIPLRLSLTKFKGTRQLKRGVKYRIGAEGFKTIESGFIATMKSGHRGVFKRLGPARLPIPERRGPSIWQVITNAAGLLTEANKKAAGNLNKQINDYIGLELKRWSNR